MLRHTHATDLIRADWDVSYVQERLGHAQVQSTMTYVHLDDEDMREKWQHFQEKRRDYSIEGKWKVLRQGATSVQCRSAVKETSCPLSIMAAYGERDRRSHRRQSAS